MTNIAIIAKKDKCNKIPDLERKEAKKNREMSVNIAKIAKITRFFLLLLRFLRNLLTSRSRS